MTDATDLHLAGLGIDSWRLRSTPHPGGLRLKETITMMTEEQEEWYAELYDGPQSAVCSNENCKREDWIELFWDGLCIVCSNK